MIGELALALEAVAPSRLAADWDKVGMLVGDPSRTLKRALLCIDLTEETLAEAIRRKCQAIVAYHPPIFEPITRLTALEPRGALLLRCMEHGIALFSPHTALDAVRGGVTDWLAEQLGSGERWAIEPSVTPRPGEGLKIVTFVPAYALGVVRDAMARAGAGTIGAYRKCSFELVGSGTFEGGTGSKPTEGKRGRFERVDEVRLEMVCEPSAQVAVVQAIRAVHPYEEAPIDVFRTESHRDATQGHGRVARLDRPLTCAQVVRKLRGALRLPAGAVQVVESLRARKHARVGLVPGAGFSLMAKAADAGCTLFVTGEARHHDQLAARARGCDLVLAGHSQTERGYLPRLAASLRPHLPGVAIQISSSDAPPFHAA
ncbi:MAG: Nif3-like dinuclear metal center hexameric protein [Planctomycetes bacterium]|nr:Nif3-like dinuclear metal center hexameric protein [Planctomycetota bacterium]